METLILSYRDVERLTKMEDYIKDVEDALRALGEGDAAVSPNRIWYRIGEDNSLIYVVSGSVGGRDALGIKMLTGNHDNPKRQLPHMFGAVFLCDPCTGAPLAIMDGILITYARTGAIAAVGAKYMARKDSSIIGILGSRDLARYSMFALPEILPSIEQVYVFSRTKDNREKFAEEMKKTLKLNISAVSTPYDAVKDADTIITATSATETLVQEAWVRPGTYIGAIGARNEVDQRILQKAKVVAETLEECKLHGHISELFKQNLMHEEDVYAELIDVVSGKKTGRPSNDDIMVLDSIGLAVEDAAVARTLYEKAKKERIGTNIDFYGGAHPW